MIYGVDITNEANKNRKFYFSLAETTFKGHYDNNKLDVKHIEYQYNTELSNLKNLKKII